MNSIYLVNINSLIQACGPLKSFLRWHFSPIAQICTTKDWSLTDIKSSRLMGMVIDNHGRYPELYSSRVRLNIYSTGQNHSTALSCFDKSKQGHRNSVHARRDGRQRGPSRILHPRHVHHRSALGSLSPIRRVQEIDQVRYRRNRTPQRPGRGAEDHRRRRHVCRPGRASRRWSLEFPGCFVDRQRGIRLPARVQGAD